MDKTYEAFLAALRAALTGEAGPLPEGYDEEKLGELARRHELCGLVLRGLDLCGADRNSALMAKLRKIAMGQLLADRKQRAALDKLFAMFEENGIDYMPVKGTLLKPLYPAPELRTMGDADILIREEQYPKIAELMQKAGYTYGHDTGYHYDWSCAALHVELHRRLTSEEEDRNNYYADSWRLAKHVTGCRYEMCPEEHYIFLLMHMTRHYLAGGVGARQLMDLWVWRRRYCDLDEAYIAQNLDAVGLALFDKSVLQTVQAWLENGVFTPAAYAITKHVLGAGVFGSLQQWEIARISAKSNADTEIAGAKLRRLLQMAFPKWKIMVRMYPVLKKYPVLAPFCWLHRAWDRLVNKKRKTVVKLTQIAETDQVCVSEYREMLETVGLE